MKKLPRLVPNKYDGIVAAVVLALAALVGACFWGAPEEDAQALSTVVTIDGEEVDRFTLAQIGEEERTYTNNGVTLTVALYAAAPPEENTLTSKESVGVRVSRSDCPTQDCVHTGKIDKAGQSIVCLPAHIVITLVGGADSGYDVIVG